MNLDFKNLPVGNLPYDTLKSCKQMVLRLYKNIPYLPELPIIEPNDSIINRTIANIPCITIKDGKILLSDTTNAKFESTMSSFEKIFNSGKLYDLNQFGYNSPFMELYFAMLEKFQPQYALVNLIGPFTFANMIFNKNPGTLLTDRLYLKFIVNAITIKALWNLYIIKTISPKTTPIIFFNEDLLYKFGTLKRTNDNITNDTIVALFKAIFSKIQKAGAVVGVQSFQKCNWQLIFDTNCVKYISFDAYNNPSSLNILSSSVNSFLANGGYINWGFVPVMNENSIRFLKLDTMIDKFKTCAEGLITAGVSADLIYNNMTISVNGDLSKYPLLFAEKALMMAHQLSEKIPDIAAM